MTPAWSHTHVPILMSESAYMSVVSFAFITEPSYILTPPLPFHKATNVFLVILPARKSRSGRLAKCSFSGAFKGEQMMLVTTEGRGLERCLPQERKKKNEVLYWAVGCKMNTLKDIRLDLGGRTPPTPQASASLQDLVHYPSVVLARNP